MRYPRRPTAMQLEPYNLPPIPDYGGPAFRASTRRWQPILRPLIAEHDELYSDPDNVWVVHHPSRGPDALGQRVRPIWTLKVYACVRPRYYWPTVRRLIDRFGTSRAIWKFYWAPDGYERPDKIVVYARTAADLRRRVRELRAVVDGCSFHPLRHTAATGALGLEPPEAQGLYVGCDPDFLGQSWRMYRTLCWAWAGLNRDYLETLPRGGAARWFERMNLSRAHEGPASLAPKTEDLRYIRRYWRQMF